MRRPRALVAILLLASLDAFGAEGLRTLFHSADEREQLDRIRRGEPAAQESAARRGEPPAVTGYVKRSDGRDTVWLDGQPVTGPEAQRLVDPPKVPEPTGGNRAIEIKRSR